MRRWLGPALILALVAAAPAASQAQSRALYHVGDSLGVGTGLYLPRVLSGWSIRSYTKVSLQAHQIPRVLRSAGTLPRYVIVTGGTNGDPRGAGAFRRAIRSTLSTVGSSRCVVWANIVRPPVAGRSYARLNRVLRQEARRHRNLIVADWVGLVRRNPQWLAPDGVHVDGAGYRARARLLARRLRHCR